jgi:hypothetical protein
MDIGVNPIQTRLNHDASVITSYKNIGCAYYRSCVVHAARLKWASFVCTSCPLFGTHFDNPDDQISIQKAVNPYIQYPVRI